MNKHYLLICLIIGKMDKIIQIMKNNHLTFTNLENLVVKQNIFLCLFIQAVF